MGSSRARARAALEALLGAINNAKSGLCLTSRQKFVEAAGAPGRARRRRLSDQRPHQRPGGMHETAPLLRPQPMTNRGRFDITALADGDGLLVF